jgi:Zn-dependent protease with chaperone function
MARVSVAAGVPQVAADAGARAAGRLLAAAIAVVAGVAVAIGLVVGLLAVWWAGIAAAAGVGGAAWLALIAPRLRSAEARAVELVGPSRPADPRTEARLLNLVEGLAPGAGLPRPAVFVVDDDAPNALALGRDGRRGVIVVTTGLLTTLDRMQLEAVVALLLVQIRDGFSSAATMSLAFRPSRLPPPVPFAIADSRAVTLTRFPPALASALESVAAAGPAVPRRAAAVLRPLWLAPPGDTQAAAERVEALRGL